MKIGIRKPSVKKSIKARTTGKIKRSIKKSVNPIYGKKGIGLINDPKKAMYNKVYNKTTIGVTDLNITSSTRSSCPPVEKHSGKTYKFFGILGMIFGILFLLVGLISFAVGGFIFVIPAIFLILLSKYCLKLSKIKKEVEE